MINKLKKYKIKTSIFINNKEYIRYHRTENQAKKYIDDKIKSKKYVDIVFVYQILDGKIDNNPYILDLRYI